MIFVLKSAPDTNSVFTAYVNSVLTLALTALHGGENRLEETYSFTWLLLFL